MWEDYSVKFMAKKSGFKLSDLPLKTGASLGSAAWWGKDILDVLQHMGAFKEGGRVRGVGKAKRGFGRALRKK